MCKKNIFSSHISISVLVCSLCLFLLCSNLAAQQTIKSDTIIARQGDGIFKILRENGYDPGEYIDYFIRINQDRIVNENQLIVGEKYYLPPIDDTLSNQTQYYLDSLVKSQFGSPVSEEPLTFIEDTAKIEEVSAELKDEESETISKIQKDYIVDSLDEVITEVVRPFPEKNAKNWGLRHADTVKSNKLEGAIIYVVSGHGGPDPGAIANVDGYTISEDEYAYDISLRIAKNIEEHGGKSIMIIKDPFNGIRDDRILAMDVNEYCYPNLCIPLNHIKRLRQRVDAVNTLYRNNRHFKYHRLVEIHLDSRSTSTNLDVFFYHYTKSTKGREFALTIRDVFDEKYAYYQPNRGYEGTVSGRNLYVIRRTHPPAILIELGNIQNKRDQRRFLDSNNRQALANWITEGIIRDFKNNQ